jgi:hypothetical protein
LPAPREFNLKAISLIEKDEGLYVYQSLINKLSKPILISGVAFRRPVEWTQDLQCNSGTLPGGKKGWIAQPDLLLGTQASISSKPAHDQGARAIRQAVV